jgi:hypothetical protein
MSSNKGSKIRFRVILQIRDLRCKHSDRELPTESNECKVATCIFRARLFETKRSFEYSGKLLKSIF